MDADLIDRVAKNLAIAGTRRGILRLLAPLPLAGVFAVHLAERRAAADGSGACVGCGGHRNHPHHHHDHHENKKNRPNRKNKPHICTPICGSKICGDDGCSGSCGPCESGTVCCTGGLRCGIGCETALNCLEGQTCTDGCCTETF